MLLNSTGVGVPRFRHATATRRCRRPTTGSWPPRSTPAGATSEPAGRLGGVVRRAYARRWSTAFADTYSGSLQQTLFAMGGRVARTGPSVAEIRLTPAQQAPPPRRPGAVRPGQPGRGVHRRRPAVRADRGHRARGRRRRRRRGVVRAWTRRWRWCSPSTLGRGPGGARPTIPTLLPIAGGTDVMVELNFDRRRPAGAARPDPDRRAAPTWSVDGDLVRIGAGVT